MFIKKEVVYCPVCREDGVKLGDRDSRDYFDGHCSECRATYYFKPGIKLPYKVITDKQRDAKCGCVNCRIDEND